MRAESHQMSIDHNIRPAQEEDLYSLLLLLPELAAFDLPEKGIRLISGLATCRYWKSASPNNQTRPL